MNYNSSQLQIINSNESKIVVSAAAGSGKTATIIGRVQRLLDEGVDSNGIVVITFTNNAANEMLKRIKNPQNMFVGTIHSYVNHLLNYAGINTGVIIEEEEFDELFTMLREHPEIVRYIEHLFLDEAQDVVKEEFDVILKILQPKNWLFVGDVRQSIYGFRGASPKTLLEVAATPGVSTYYLNENYRCDRMICDYARAVISNCGIGYEDHTIPISDKMGAIIDLPFNDIKVANLVRMNGDFKDWFIVCRTNKEVDIMKETLQNQRVPHEIIRRQDMNNDDLEKAMGRNTVKIMTIHAAKGLEANNVVVVGAKFFNLEERCISYVAATRAKHLLVNIKGNVAAKTYQKRGYVHKW